MVSPRALHPVCFPVVGTEFLNLYLLAIVVPLDDTQTFLDAPEVTGTQVDPNFGMSAWAALESASNASDDIAVIIYPM